jgi:hypothetical protein
VTTPSLADQAIAALASVRAMDDGIDNTLPERHIVRSLKRNAEQILADAFRQVSNLAYLAADVRNTFRDATREHGA